MKYKEFGKKSEQQEDLFVIILSMELTDPENLIQEMREWKEIVVNWYDARRQAAAEVRFIVVSDPMYHQAIEEFTELCYANDVDLKVVFKSAKLQLDLHDGNGNKIRERVFEKGKDTSNIFERWFGRSK
ncbi:hypothetical protein WJ542_23985 [Paraburkholderia sp. B3]|uniref:hypothetical protein n=1 Tax=Paraburkholderia sp. B3 TaxID=3134791 RepID=UPI003982CB6D